MKHSDPWSRRSSNDTLTSDTLTNFLSTNASSPRSSTASLPFADDLVQQNKLDWEHIERIFYGEEPLPADEKTREELQDWMETFPYLRVVGKQIKPDRFRPDRNPIHHEEILAMDPAPHQDRGILKKPSVSFGCPKSSSQTVARRRCYDCDMEDNRRLWHPSDLPKLSGSSLTPRVETYGKKLDRTSTGPLTARPGGLSSNSANLFRLPTIGSSTSSSSGKGVKWTGGGRLTHRTLKPSPLTTTVTLPLINVNKLTFGDLLTTRSISALHSTKPEERDPRRPNK